MSATSGVLLESTESAFAGSSSDVVRRSGLPFGIVVAAVVAISIIARSGLGLTLSLAALLVGMAVGVGWSTSSGRWCLTTMLLLPWLVIRDNTWLAISIVCTVLIVLVLAAVASATRQSLSNMSLSALLRIGSVPTAQPNESRAGSRAETEENVLAVVRGVLLASPIVLFFWWLLASADDVFASIINPSSVNLSIVPFGRIGMFIALSPFLVAVGTYAATRRTPSAKKPSVLAAKYFGPVESTIVLGAVSSLFAVFVALRVATLGQPLDEAVWRSEVRSGFFQLLWVAALTVLLVLVIHHLAGESGLVSRVRRLGWLAIALAAAIDVLAMVRIAEYVERSFQTPLRFWSFGFGVWLLALLGLTALRLSTLRVAARWFIAAALASWMIFLFALGVINPDQRIAQHNFDNAPTGENEWIAVQPLMWLSEDATDVIVENIEVLRPMPNDRFVRTRDHLCSTDREGGWRALHFSRGAAKDAVADLC